MTLLAPPSDADLARRVQAGAGDRAEAEAELCRRFRPRVRAYGARHLRDPDTADELCQRVLMLVIEKLRGQEVREPESIASFVLGTARQIAHGMRRGEARMRPLTDAVEPWHEPATPLDTRRLAECMKRLAERDRAVVVLSFFDDLSAPEVAVAIGITPVNVRVMRHRAVSALRECLESRGHRA
jgi:RNA polymerase sigma-70 factor, ECF subfamily